MPYGMFIGKSLPHQFTTGKIYKIVPETDVEQFAMKVFSCNAAHNYLFVYNDDRFRPNGMPSVNFEILEDKESEYILKREAIRLDEFIKEWSI